ncbi:MAG: GTPase HflX [Planctomycetota bacterium]|nr:GTPase HflX [Planctomycetota bacterium]
MSSKRLFKLDNRKPERVILAAGITPNEEETSERSLAELRDLVETAAGDVVGQLTQKIPHQGLSAFLGSGKLAELANMVKQLEADLVAFDTDLKPSQAKKIEDHLDCRIVDRTEVILAIFARHARSKEARVQVELAQLEYSAPRQKHRWSHLWRQTAGYAIGTRGPGEKQLEMDRRELRKRMTDLRNELKQIQARRSRVVAARPSQYTVSLVGYTNSGKSTTLNRITGSDELVRDKLFSTLDTRTRSLELEGGLTAYISDTVGFIRKLPTHLVASFHATLEEARNAKLLVHVVDASQPDVERQIEAVNEVLDSLGCDTSRILLTFNKVDLIGTEELSLLAAKYDDPIFYSARTGEDFEKLVEAIFDRLLEDALHVTVAISLDEARLITETLGSGFVKDSKYNGTDAILELEIPKRELDMLLSRGARKVAKVGTGTWEDQV